MSCKKIEKLKNGKRKELKVIHQQILIELLKENELIWEVKVK